MATELAGTRSSGAVQVLRQALSTLLRARSGSGARRAAALGDSLDLFETHAVRRAPDGYPRVAGTIGGREIKLSFIPDSLAVKRLPQLWLSVVIRHDRACAPLALTARPRGDDYVSFGASAGASRAVPDWLPRDFAVHGCENTPGRIEQLREGLESTFHDRGIKEVAFLSRRIHLLYRLAEGRRGRHLLFREPLFDEVLTRETLARLVNVLSRLADEMTDLFAPAPKGACERTVGLLSDPSWSNAHPRSPASRG